MMRWVWKRWVWAALTGAAIMAGSATLAQPGKSGSAGPKASDIITLRLPGHPDQKVTVVKSTRKPDGSIETEVKDTKTGETFTLIEAASGKDDVPLIPASKSSKSMGSTRAEKPEAAKEPPKERERSWRLFGGNKSGPSMPMPFGSTGPTAAPTDMPTNEGGKRPGILSRIFGSKKNDSSPSAMPAASTPTPTLYGSPKPPGHTISPTPVQLFPRSGSGSDVPRVMPSKPTLTPPGAPALSGAPVRLDPVVRPPAPIVPAPAPPALLPPMPKSNPAPAPAQAPLAIPQPPPTPTITPTVPVVPAVPTVPTIPPLPGSGGPTPGLQPASYVSPSKQMMMMKDIEPHVKALTGALAPSARMTAATALAQCRHASTDWVKALLFQSAKVDPCPMVRAACIDHLCTLGYYHRPFMDYLKTACDDPSEDVRTAAKSALSKMSPR